MPALLPGLLLTPLGRIATGKGDVFHAIKASDPGFAGFGEAYFTSIDFGARKGWRRHREMTMNLVVVSGRVRFGFWDDRDGTPREAEVMLSPDEPNLYARLTVPPGLWMMFEGVGSGLNLTMNLADRAHDPAEADTLDLASHPTPATPAA